MVMKAEKKFKTKKSADQDCDEDKVEGQDSREWNAAFNSGVLT